MCQDWSRDPANLSIQESTVTLYISLLRRREGEQSTEVDAKKVQILAEKFLLLLSEQSLITAGASQPARMLEVDQLVTQEEV